MRTPILRRRQPKEQEERSAHAKQLVDVLLNSMGFDPQKFAIFDVCDQEINRVVRGCKTVAIKGKRLYLHAPSAMHRQEIIYSRKRIIDRLNQVFGTSAVSDICFTLESTT